MPVNSLGARGADDEEVVEVVDEARGSVAHDSPGESAIIHFPDFCGKDEAELINTSQSPTKIKPVSSLSELSSGNDLNLTAVFTNFGFPLDFEYCLDCDECGLDWMFDPCDFSVLFSTVALYVTVHSTVLTFWSFTSSIMYSHCFFRGLSHDL